MEFSTSSMHKLIKSECNNSVSKPAAKELGEVLEEFGLEVAEEAVRMPLKKDIKSELARIRGAACKIHPIRLLLLHIPFLPGVFF